MEEINLLEMFNPKGLPIQSLLGDYQNSRMMVTKVSLEFVAANVDTEKLAFNLYSPVIVAIIDELTANKRFPYNSVVEEEVSKQLGFKGEGVARIVYGSQGFTHRRDAILRAIEQADILIKEGYQPLGNPDEKLRKKFMFLSPGTTWLGQATTIKKQVPELLIKDAQGHYYFIKRANSRKGIRVTEHTYVKAA